MSRTLNREEMDFMSAQLASEMAAELKAEVETEPFDPGRKKERARPPKKWEPLHGPTQKKIFRDTADVVGACGEKFTGKSIVFADKIVAHCYMEWDALAVIIGNSHRALAEGICHDLTTFTLPRWRDGNRAPMFKWENGKLVENPDAGKLIDNGIGLEFTGWKTDPNNKDLYLKIRNRFGGWSRIRVISIPYADMVRERVTNMNASLYYLEEATNCNGKDYYTRPVLQLNRRRGITGPQQFLFSCNPDDPENWVCEWMYKDPAVVVGKTEPGRDYPDDPHKPGIRRDPGVSFYYLHYHENAHNVSQKNRETLHKALKAEPILRARLLESKWIAMPSGEALFKSEFSETRHIRGDVEKGRGLTPIPGHPIVISFDWGSRSIGLTFKQIIETEEGPFDLAFDEITYHQEMVKTRRLAVAILEKMRFWLRWLREKTGDERSNWCWWMITGDDATTNWNPESGSINARDLEDHMHEVAEEDPQRYAGIEIPIIRGCPRPKGSVDKRMDIVAEQLMEDMAVISSFCSGHRSMFFHLERDPENPSHPKKGNRWIHIIDGYSYANYYRRFVLGSQGFYNYSDGDAVTVS